MKPADFIHVAGACLCCGLVAYYLMRPAPGYYDPQQHAHDPGAELVTSLDPIASLVDDSRDRIWNAALAYEQQGRDGDALGCYERFLMLYPADAQAPQARERIAALNTP